MSGDPKGKEDLRKVKLDLALLEHQLDRRGHQRVRPTQEEPVRVVVDGESRPVHDIGQGGVTLDLDQPAGPGWVLAGDLILPSRVLPVPVVLAVVGRDEDGLARAQFRDLGKPGQRAIAEYVRQRKRQILARDA